MRLPDTLPVLASLVALTATAVTAWFLGAARSGELAAPSDPRLARELGRLVEAQERTLAVLERLAEGLEAGPLPAPVRAMPARARVEAERAGDSSSERWLSALEDVRATFATESHRTQELLRGAPALGGESLTEVRERRRDTDWNALEVFEAAWRRDSKAASRTCHFLTMRELLEAYGPPTDLYRPQGGLIFHYARDAGPEWYFRLQDGTCIEAWVEDKGKPDQGG